MRAARRIHLRDLVGPLEYSIQGDNLQVARIQLKPGQQIYAEAGKMVYKTTSVYWETRMSGATIGEKLLGALKRTVMGESIFLTYFHSDTSGEVGFAGNYPGKLAVFDLVGRAEHARAARRVRARRSQRATQRRAGEAARRGILRRRRIHSRKD